MNLGTHNVLHEQSTNIVIHKFKSIHSILMKFSSIHSIFIY